MLPSDILRLARQVGRFLWLRRTQTHLTRLYAYPVSVLAELIGLNAKYRRQALKGLSPERAGPLGQADDAPLGHGAPRRPYPTACILHLACQRTSVLWFLLTLMGLNPEP